jgi:hypothetical protein
MFWLFPVVPIRVGSTQAPPLSTSSRGRRLESSRSAHNSLSWVLRCCSAQLPAEPPCVLLRTASPTSLIKLTQSCGRQPARTNQCVRARVCVARSRRSTCRTFLSSVLVPKACLTRLCLTVASCPSRVFAMRFLSGVSTSNCLGNRELLSTPSTTRAVARPRAIVPCELLPF